MKIGIVGSEGVKFTEKGQLRAKGAILDILKFLGPNSDDAIVSGGCHLGGIDVWAEELASKLFIKTEIYKPAKLNWSEGYKPRNLQIAHNSDIVYCITVDKLPDDYKGMTFKVCYHCARAGKPTEHIKSGGCWTALQAEKKGKEARWIVIKNE